MFTVFLSVAGASAAEIRRSLRSLEAQEDCTPEIIMLGQASGPAEVLDGAEKTDWRGDYAFFLQAGDSLAGDALRIINDALDDQSSGPEASLVIFDHHLRGGLTRRLPGWDPHLLAWCDYVHRACCLSRAAVAALAGTRPTGLHEALLSLAESPQRVLHVPELLAVIDAEAVVPRAPAMPTGQLPALSLIIPNRNGMDLLPGCLAFLRRVDFPVDLIIVDNASTDPALWPYYERLRQDFGARIIPFNQPFNYAAMINLGVAAATHDLILLLNNDVVIGDVSELQLAMRYACRPEVGVVGSVLRYPDGTVQHAGMVLSWHNGQCDAHHILRHAQDGEQGHIGALTAVRNFMAVTGAFQLTRKQVFHSVGGYDEARLPVEHNDVDFCLRLRAAGLHVVTIPALHMVHDESRTRSKMKTTEARELAKAARNVMKARWPSAFDHDPHYNPALREKHASGWRDWRRPRRKGLMNAIRRIGGFFQGA
ncbi:MAG: glycosyltransferase [Rhizobiales bacterium]|nr:glycosyltransferase [Hyphomicrobiales bacterium]